MNQPSSSKLTTSNFESAFNHLPLVAILRGVRPEEVESVALRLYEAGFRIIEVPLNSPQALLSIEKLAQCMPADALIGAGTVLNVDAVQQVHQVGGRLIVMPHSDLEVIRASKKLGMVCAPGVATLTEAFAAIHASADALKFFPAELVTPSVLKAMCAVLPKNIPLIPVGGITPEGMKPYRDVGAHGFGLGGALYSPGMSSDEVGLRAKAFVQAWKALN